MGIVEDGKYFNLAEDPQPAMFLPILQSPSSVSWLVVRSGRDPQQVAAAIRNKLRELDAGLPLYIQPWSKEMDGALFASRVATVSLGVLGMMGAMLSITGIFGMAAYSVSRRLRELGNSYRRRCAAARKCYRQHWDEPSNCWQLVPRQDCSSDFWRPGCWLSSCIRQLPAIRWYWLALFSRWRCWGCWLRGFQRNVPCRLIL